MPPIYHFTDFYNLEPILQAGALRCYREAPNKVDVGDQNIKGNRTWIEVGCGPGGVVCDYVPFYFAPRSPMLSSIKFGNVPGVDPNQNRLAYFVSSTEAAYDAGLDCVFSDGNAAAYSITTFNADPENLATHVDWDVMKLTIWKNTDADPDRRRRRMAEFLVHESVRLDLISEIAVRTDKMRAAVAKLVEEAGWDLPVIRRPGWYF